MHPKKRKPGKRPSITKSILAICCGVAMIYMAYEPYRTGVMHDLGKGFGYFTYAEHPYKFTFGMVMWVILGVSFIFGGILSVFSNIIKVKNKTDDPQ